MKKYRNFHCVLLLFWGIVLLSSCYSMFAPSNRSTHTSITNAQKHLVAAKNDRTKRDDTDADTETRQGINNDSINADALDAFYMYLDTTPHNPDAWLKLGNAYNEQGRTLKSVNCYEKAIGLVDTQNVDPGVLEYVAGNYNNMGIDSLLKMDTVAASFNFDRADRFLTLIKDPSKRALLFVNFGQEHERRANDFSGAITCYHNAIIEGSDDKYSIADAYNKWGTADRVAGKPEWKAEIDSSIEYYKILASRPGGNLTACQVLVQEFEMLGMKKQARPYEDAIEASDQAVKSFYRSQDSARAASIPKSNPKAYSFTLLNGVKCKAMFNPGGKFLNYPDPGPLVEVRLVQNGELIFRKMSWFNKNRLNWYGLCQGIPCADNNDHLTLGYMTCEGPTERYRALLDNNGKMTYIWESIKLAGLIGYQDQDLNEVFTDALAGIGVNIK